VRKYKQARAFIDFMQNNFYPRQVDFNKLNATICSGDVQILNNDNDSNVDGSSLLKKGFCELKYCNLLVLNGIGRQRN